MIGMRYGTVPIVRGVGGLVNTVFDWDYDPNHPVEERNGFVFYQTDFRGVESAIERAIDLWKFAPDRFKALAIQGMNCDYSWKQSAETYSNIYEFIRHK
jgi:starch synthase